MSRGLRGGGSVLAVETLAELRAADVVLRDARGFGHSDFKIELARRGIVRTLMQAVSGTPQSQADKRVA